MNWLDGAGRPIYIPASVYARTHEPCRWGEGICMARQVAVGAGLPLLGARVSKARRREAIAGYLFLLPWAIGFVLFVAGPLIASAGLSFTAFDVARPPR